MSKLSAFIKWLWGEIQFANLPWVQNRLVPFLHRAKEIARLLVKPYVPLYELAGKNQAGALTVTYGGLDYCKGLLISKLFSGEPRERKIGRIFAWRPGTLDFPATSDLAIIESSKYLVRRLAQHNALTLPYRVQFILDIQGEWQQVEQRFHTNIRRNIKKALNANCYESEISHREQDLVLFYQTMYLPTVHARHGGLAAVLPESEALQILKHGWLLLVKRDGVCVCGMIGFVQQNVVEFRELGVLNGDEKLLKEAVIDIMLYLGIQWAHQEGSRAVNWGDGWPYLSRNFSSKRKWGGTVSVPPNQHKQIWMRIQRNTPAVSHFLKENPCVISDGNGKIYGLVVTDDPNQVTLASAAAWRKQYATPGLANLQICSVTDLMESQSAS